MTELVILTVLFAGTVLGWMIRHWSARRQFAEHSRHRQLEQLQDLTPAEAAANNNHSGETMARFNTDGSQSLESRLLELEEQNSDLTKSFAIKEREADQLLQKASLVKPLEFELELATEEISRLNAERDHQLSLTQAAIYTDETQAIRVSELEQQLEIAQQEIEAIRRRGGDSATPDTSHSAELDATIDTAFDASVDNRLQALVAEREELESVNAELLKARDKSEKQRHELRSELDDAKRESSDYQKIHRQSVTQIEQLQEKLRIRDDDLLALNTRVDQLTKEQAKATETHANNLLTEVSHSRDQNDRLKETEEKLEHFDSTLARLSDLEQELGSSSQRSEEMIGSLQTYKEQNERLTLSLRQSESETASLQSQVENNSQRVLELESQLSSSEEVALHYDDEIIRLSKQNEILLEQNHKFKKTLQSKSLETKHIQEKKLADLQQSTKEINRTNRKLEDTRKALADSERELLQLKAEQAERDTHLSNSAAKIVTLTAESSKSESLLQSRNEEIEQLDKKLTALQNDLVAEKVVSQDLRTNVEENTQHAEKQHDIQRRRMAIQGVVAKNRAYSLNQLQSHLEVVVSGKDENIRSLEGANQGLVQWRERYAEMEKKLVIKDEQIKKLDSAIKQSEIVEGENQKLRQKAESDMEDVVSGKDENIRSLENTNKELLQWRDDLEKKLVIKDEQIKKLDSAIKQSEIVEGENQKLLQKAEADMEDVVSGKDENIRSLENTNKELLQRRDDLEKKLVTKDEQIKKLDTAIKQSETAEGENQKLLQKAEADMKVVVSGKDENIRSLENTNKELLQRRDDLEKKLVTKDEQIKKLDTAIKQSETAEGENQKLLQKAEADMKIVVSGKDGNIRSLENTNKELLQRRDDLEKKLVTKDEQIKKLDTAIKQSAIAEGENQKLLQKAEADMKVVVSGKDENIRSLENTNKELLQWRDVLEKKLVTKDERIKELDSAIKQGAIAEGENQKLLQKAESDMKVVVSGKDENIRTLENTNKELLQSRNDLEKKLVIKDERIKKLDSTIKQSEIAEGENQKLLQKAESDMKVVVSGKDENIRSLENTNKELLQSRNDLEKKLVIKDERIKKLDSAIKQSEIAEGENQKLIQQTEALQNDNKSLSIKIAETHGRAERLQEQNTTLAKSTEIQGIALKKSSQNVAELKSQLAQNKESLSQLNQQMADIPALKDNIRAFQKENSDMRLQINRISTLEADIMEKDAMIAKQNMEMQQIGDKITEGLAQKDSEIQVLRDDLVDKNAIEKQLQEVQTNLVTAEQQANRIPAMQATLRARDELIVKLNSESTILKDSQVQAAQSQEELQQEIDNKNKEIDGLQASAEQLRQARQHILVLQEQTKDVERLRLDVAEKNRNLTTLKEQNGALASEFQKLAAGAEDHKVLEGRYRDIQNELQTQKQSSLQSQAQLQAQMQRERVQFEKRLESVETQRTQVAQRLETETTLHEKLQNQIESAASEHRNLQDQMQREREQFEKRLESVDTQRTEVAQRLEAATTLHEGLQKQIDSAATERSNLQDQMQREREQFEKRLESVDTQRAEVAQRLEAATTLHEGLQKQIKTASSERNNLQTQLGQMSKELAKAPDTAEFDQLQEQVLANKSEISELEKKLQVSREQTTDSNTLKKRLRAEEELTGALTESQKENEIEIRRMQSEMMALQESVKNYQNDLAISRKRMAELESSSNFSNNSKSAAAKPSIKAAKNDSKTSARKSSTQLFKPPKEKDDLKKIYGIGPVMERTLNGLGILSYKQIADFSEQDIERVAAAIESFSDRIERDDWVGGARKCYEKKYRSKA